MRNIWQKVKVILALKRLLVKWQLSRESRKNVPLPNLLQVPEELVSQQEKQTQDLTESNSLVALVPSELPIYRYTHPHGCISVYVPTNMPLSPEKVLLLLEQAKFDLLYRQPA